MGFMDPNCKLVYSPKDIPPQEHYAILKFSSSSTSTYEMNDGSVTVIRYEAYTSREAWLAEIKDLETKKGYGGDYKAVIIKPKDIKINISVDVDDKS